MLLQVCDKSQNGGLDELPSESAYPTAEAFLEHCERPSIKSRAVVFHQGEPSEDPYLILDSSVSVIVDNIEDPEHVMAVNCLNPGEFFGEMELFDDDHRTATPSHTVRRWLRQLSRLPPDSAVVPGCALCAYDPDGKTSKKYHPLARRSHIYRRVRAYLPIAHSAHHITRSHGPL